jgi:hypothetical protein
MLEKHVIWLQLWDNTQSNSMIQADIPISLFLLQNTKNLNKKTEIISILKRRNLTTDSFEYLDPKYSIPLAFHNIFKKLITFIESKNLKLEYKTKTIKSSGTKKKLPTKYTLEDMWAVDTFTIKEGIIVKKAIELHPDANKRKLIISNKSSFNGAFIDDGKLSLTGNHKFYILGDKLKLLKKMLEFKIINIMSYSTKYGQDFLDNDIFKYIPDIRKLDIDDITEKEFYTLIGLTSQEIEKMKLPSLIELDKNDINEEIIEPSNQEINNSKSFSSSVNSKTKKNNHPIAANTEQIKVNIKSRRNTGLLKQSNGLTLRQRKNKSK